MIRIEVIDQSKDVMDADRTTSFTEFEVAVVAEFIKRDEAYVQAFIDEARERKIPQVRFPIWTEDILGRDNFQGFGIDARETPATSWEEFFKFFKYRPDATIEYSVDKNFRAEKLTIIRYVKDTYDPRNEIPVKFDARLPEFEGERMALMVVRSLIHDMELHEADEWFRYKGSMPFNPHAKETVGGR